MFAFAKAAITDKLVRKPGIRPTVKLGQLPLTYYRKQQR